MGKKGGKVQNGPKLEIYKIDSREMDINCIQSYVNAFVQTLTSQ